MNSFRFVWHPNEAFVALFLNVIETLLSRAPIAVGLTSSSIVQRKSENSNFKSLIANLR
jgi:hypothetical protein